MLGIASERFYSNLLAYPIDCTSKHIARGRPATVVVVFVVIVDTGSPAVLFVVIVARDSAGSSPLQRHIVRSFLPFPALVPLRKNANGPV